jgi:hypothetical protein
MLLTVVQKGFHREELIGLVDAEVNKGGQVVQLLVEVLEPLDLSRIATAFRLMVAEEVTETKTAFSPVVVVVLLLQLMAMEQTVLLVESLSQFGKE